MRFVLLVVVLFIGSPTWAINKCTNAKGKAVFQDAPCSGRGEQIEVRPPSLLGDPEEARKVAAESARKREFAAQQQISSVTSGLNIPGLF